LLQQGLNFVVRAGHHQARLHLPKAQRRGRPGGHGRLDRAHIAHKFNSDAASAFGVFIAQQGDIGRLDCGVCRFNGRGQANGFN
jgi:hypothetical protein